MIHGKIKLIGNLYGVKDYFERCREYNRRLLWSQGKFMKMFFYKQEAPTELVCFSKINEAKIEGSDEALFTRLSMVAKNRALSGVKGFTIIT